MLRGRTLSKRDSSVCAFCRYRIAVQQPTAPRSRPFSVTTSYASENDSKRPILFPPFPQAGRPGGFVNTSTPGASNPPSSVTGAPGIPPRGIYAPQNGTVPPAAGGKPVGGPTLLNRRQDDFLLNHEAKARQNMLAQKVERLPPRAPAQQPLRRDDPLLRPSPSPLRQTPNDFGRRAQTAPGQQPLRLDDSFLKPAEPPRQQAHRGLGQPAQQLPVRPPTRLDESSFTPQNPRAQEITRDGNAGQPTPVQQLQGTDYPAQQSHDQKVQGNTLASNASEPTEARQPIRQVESLPKPAQSTTQQATQSIGLQTPQAPSQQLQRLGDSLPGSDSNDSRARAAPLAQSIAQPGRPSRPLDDFLLNSSESRARQSALSRNVGQAGRPARPLDDFLLNSSESRARNNIRSREMDQQVQQPRVQQPPVQQSPVQQPRFQQPRRPMDFTSSPEESRARQNMLARDMPQPTRGPPVQERPVPQSQNQQPKRPDDFTFSPQESRAQPSIPVRDISQEIQRPLVSEPPVQQSRTEQPGRPSDVTLSSQASRDGQDALARSSPQVARDVPVQEPPVPSSPVAQPAVQQPAVQQSPAQQPAAQQSPIQRPPFSRPRPIDDFLMGTESRARQSILAQKAEPPSLQPRAQWPPAQQPPVQQPPVQQPSIPQSPIPQSPFQRARPLDDFLLGASESKARQSILAQKNAPPPEPKKPQVNAKYIWDTERQKDIERYLRDDAIHGDSNRLRQQRELRHSTPPPPSFLDDQGSAPMRAADRNYSRQVFDYGGASSRSQFEGPARTQNQYPSSESRNDWQPQYGRRDQEFSQSGASNSNYRSSFDSRNAESYNDMTPSDFANPAARDSSYGLPARNESGRSDPVQSQEWGQLARKSPTTMQNSDEFWAVLENDNSQSQPPPQSPPRNSRPTKPVSSGGWDFGPADRVAETFSDAPDTARRNTQSDYRDSWSETTPNESHASVPDYRSQNEAQSWGASQETTQSSKGGRQNKYDEGEYKQPAKGRGGKSSGRRPSRFLDDGGPDDYEEYVDKRKRKEQRKAQREAERTGPVPIILPELINVTALAKALQVKPEQFLQQLAEFGFEGVTLDSFMAGETAALVAQEYGYEPTIDTGASQDLKPRPPPEEPWKLPARPPVVTIMGHVDHGKTTILDYLRKSSVAAGEHGGITQHIGAFSVTLSSGKQITFLDTPGHAAFLSMRQRGANVTDIVVLVVAADDGVMPQTLEALKHARAAKVPMIVAINKIDADGANVDLVKNDLATNGVEIEDFGGDIQVVCVSGKTGQGMSDLEENILALSEILDHRAEVDGPAEGWILESSLKTSGKVATVLIKRGTLRTGDYIAAGLTWAKVRHLRNEAGVDVEEAPPGTPVEVFGWKDLPAAGDQVIQSPTEDRAKRAASYRAGLREREKDAAEYEVIAEARKALQEKRAREKAMSEMGVDAPEELPEEENGAKLVNFVVKGDVHGSVEAVCACIQEIGNHEVRPRILRSATGPISEFDVEHAAMSKSVLVNFASPIAGHIAHLAESQGVQILDHNVIYHVIDDVKKNLASYLPPDISTRVVGDAEVLEVFPINIHKRVYKNIAGCKVRNGFVHINHLYRVVRNGKVIWDGKLETLKNIQKTVTEIRKGTDCGMSFDGFQDFEVGDTIQSYEEVRTPRQL